MLVCISVLCSYRHYSFFSFYSCGGLKSNTPTLFENTLSQRLLK